ncbi:MAG: hypothetical protein M4579_001868 [Chaenotheca gracillima]|nr:MAG: hypothetical protein M4579_001868 [Chaenotheca gracillima]
MDEFDNISRAPQACSSCRKQKRKCDKGLPACSLCVRMSRTCDYSESTPPLSSDDFESLRQKVQELESRLQATSPNGPLLTPPSSSNDSPANLPFGGTAPKRGPRAFPPMYFLDASYFSYGRFPVPKASIPVPMEALDLLGGAPDVQLAVGTFFETVHKFFPIISKKRLVLHLANPLAESGADLALLFLCMKLVSERPFVGPEGGEMPLYSVAKRFYFLAETNNVTTLHLLQAGLLIALYEIGHGIYPAAFLTVGNCARLGYALGLRAEKGAAQMLNRCGTWTEQEERRRVWWGVVILDRYVALGAAHYPLVAEDPKLDEFLPMDDTAWDEGRMTVNEPLFVSSATDMPAGPFARLCQAAHLLGRVIRHTTDKIDDPEFRVQEALQLEKTIKALAGVLPGECFEESRLCTAISICYRYSAPFQSLVATSLTLRSALLTLYENYSCYESLQSRTPQDLMLQKTSINGLEDISKEVAWFSSQLSNILEYEPEVVSPFLSDCLYQAAANCAWKIRESGDKNATELLETLQQTISKLDQRWAIAGEYTKILSTTERILVTGETPDFVD